ncbi:MULTISPECIES: hypothetical protein [Catenuloplanes]|uniref:Uncharacterized protein n=1 Tax=Catenuloplanes niger TaxID=587534 RepID=A0AAE4CTT6_9ACTN|nr:hypothetical protein [Catenuloplanes niger]MDR7322633.1 hypothetical protein [Catenuloplanes niger]
MDVGPEVADGPDALGPLAIRILNEGLRPFMVRWHTDLRAFEAQSNAPSDESGWPRRAEFDADLQRVQGELAIYVEMLAKLAGVKS